MGAVREMVGPPNPRYTAYRLERLLSELSTLDLKELRRQHGIGVVRMGELLGCAHQNVCAIEATRNPLLETLKDYLQVVVDVDYEARGKVKK